MKFFEFLIMNIAFFLKYFWDFINSSSLLSNIASAAIIGGFLIYIFRVPSFELHAYAKLNQIKDGSVFFDVKNKKRFMAYDADDVFYKLYLPEKLFIDKQFEIEKSTFDGWKSWNPLYNFRDKDRFNIDNETYILINGASHLALFPEQGVTLFRINGNFSQKEGSYRIYFQFRTRYGFYPYVVQNGFFLKRFTGKHVDVLNGLLPYSLLKIE